LDVTEEQAVEIIKEKRQKDKDKIIRVFDENPEAKIENGRWGPFVRFGKQNLKIPKGTEVEKITYEDVMKWDEEDSKGSSAKKATRTTKTTKTAKAAKPAAKAKKK